MRRAGVLGIWAWVSTLPYRSWWSAWPGSACSTGSPIPVRRHACSPAPDPARMGASRIDPPQIRDHDPLALGQEPRRDVPPTRQLMIRPSEPQRCFFGDYYRDPVKPQSSGELKGLHALWLVLALGFAGTGGILLLGPGGEEQAGVLDVADGRVRR